MTNIQHTNTALIEELGKKVNSGSVDLHDLGRLLKSTTAAPEADLPLIVKMSDEATTAWAKLPEAVAVPVPTTRRKLDESEVRQLIEARQVISSVESLLKDAKDSIRTAVLNHLDIEVEEDPALAAEGFPTDPKGHVMVTGSLSAPDLRERFSWEVTPGQVKVDEHALAALSEDPESGFSHEDYLGVTVARRTFDEAAFVSYARKRPKVIEAVGTVLKPGSMRASLYVRRSKR